MSLAPEHPAWPQTPVARKEGLGLRVAVLILGAGVTAYIIFQIQMMYSFPYVLRLRDSSNVGGEAVMVVLLLLMGMAAVWGAPLVAAGVFVLAAALAFHLGSTTFYGDMSVWGGVALILAALCAVDWTRRGGLARYPSLQVTQKRAARIGSQLLPLIAGLIVVAVLIWAAVL